MKLNKLCERCEKVKFEKHGQQKYCGSWREKEGCSYIVHKEQIRYFLNLTQYGKKYFSRWLSKNRDERKKYNKEWRTKNPDYMKDYYLQKLKPKKLSPLHLPKNMVKIK